MSTVRRHPAPVPSTDLARAPRVLAVWVALVVCSVAAHGLAGGRTSPATVAVLGTLAGGVAAGLGWRPRPVTVTAPALAGAQLGWHLLACAVPSSDLPLGAALRSGAHHGLVTGPAGDSPGTSAAMDAGTTTMPSPVWMTLAHLAAGAVVMGALRHGERVLRWLRGLSSRVGRPRAAVAGTTTPPSPRSRTRWTYVVVLRDEVHRRPALRRGPPAVEA